jgi:hypothetical protein
MLARLLLVACHYGEQESLDLIQGSLAIMYLICSRCMLPVTCATSALYYAWVLLCSWTTEWMQDSLRSRQCPPLAAKQQRYA